MDKLNLQRMEEGQLEALLWGEGSTLTLMSRYEILDGSITYECRIYRAGQAMYAATMFGKGEQQGSIRFQNMVTGKQSLRSSSSNFYTEDQVGQENTYLTGYWQRVVG